MGSRKTGNGIAIPNLSICRNTKSSRPLSIICCFPVFIIPYLVACQVYRMSSLSSFRFLSETSNISMDRTFGKLFAQSLLAVVFQPWSIYRWVSCHLSQSFPLKYSFCFSLCRRPIPYQKHILLARKLLHTALPRKSPPGGAPGAGQSPSKPILSQFVSKSYNPPCRWMLVELHQQLHRPVRHPVAVSESMKML